MGQHSAPVCMPKCNAKSEPVLQLLYKINSSQRPTGVGDEV